MLTCWVFLFFLWPLFYISMVFHLVTTGYGLACILLVPSDSNKSRRQRTWAVVWQGTSRCGVQGKCGFCFVYASSILEVTVHSHRLPFICCIFLRKKTHQNYLLEYWQSFWCGSVWVDTVHSWYKMISLSKIPTRDTPSLNIYWLKMSRATNSV